MAKVLVRFVLMLLILVETLAAIGCFPIESLFVLLVFLLALLWGVTKHEATGG